MDNVTVFDVAQVESAAINFATSEVLGDEAIKTIATVIGTKPTYVLWNLVSTQFCLSYQKERECADTAASQAWVRLAARMKTAYGTEKPKAPSKAAVKVAAGRAKVEKAVKAAVTKHKTVAALRRQAGEALESGKPEQADIFLAAAKVTEKEEKRVSAEKLAKRWDNLAVKIKQAKKSADERILSAIEKAIETLSVKVGK